MAPRIHERSNAITASEEASYVEAVEEFNRELQREQAAYMARCKIIREKIKEVLEDAKNQGGDPKAIKAVVKRRALDAKIAAHESSLEDDTQSRFRAMMKALGGIADTDLGKAALKGIGDDLRTVSIVGAIQADLTEDEQAEWDKAAPFK